MLKTIIRKPLCVAAVLLLAGLVGAPRAAEVIIDEDLRHDPNLPKEEQIRRHKLRVEKLLAEYRAKAAEREKERAASTAQQVNRRQSDVEALRARAQQAAVQRLAAQRNATNMQNRLGGQPTGRSAPGQGAGARPSAVTQTGAGATAKVPFRVSQAIVYFKPFESLACVGDEFETEVQLFNESEKPVDELALHLKYDPLVLAPVSVNDAAIYSRLKDAPKLQANSSRGRLCYSARLEEGLQASTTTLLTIRWKALNPILYSEIEFETGQDKTRIVHKERNLLGYVAAGAQIGGTLPATVVIAPEKDSPRKLMPLFSEIALEGIDEPVHLRLEAETETVAEGEEWVVSLALRNDATLPFNDVCVRILFDPARLEVLDWHKGNWIRQGINIYDGFAHETYPFEVHRANRADNERGEILYHVATSEGRFFPSGELARIKFRARADASLADVWFDFNDPSCKPEEILTDVDFLGSSVLYTNRPKATETADRPPPDPLRRPDT